VPVTEETKDIKDLQRQTKSKAMKKMWKKIKERKAL